MFQSSFSFIAQSRGRYRDFLHTPCSHTCIASPVSSILAGVLHQLQLRSLQGHSITPRAPRLHYRSLWVLYTVSGATTCAYYYRRQSIVSALKILCALLSPKSWQPLICLLSLQVCLFQNAVLLESYSIEPFLIGFVHLVIMPFKCPFRLCMTSSLLSFCAESYSTHQMYHSLSIYLWKNILVCFQVLAVMDKTAVNIHLYIVLNSFW